MQNFELKKSLSHIYKHTTIFINSFVDKELTLFSASLSFYTIFTIIPLLLIVLTIMTNMPSFNQYYESVKVLIFSNLMPVNSEAMMGYIDGFLQNSSKMGSMGLIMVLISSILFFRNFEYIANKIFHAESRSLFKSITTYLTIITLTPIALSLSFYISASLASAMASHEITSGVNILPLIPYLIIWGLFFLLFHISVNVKVAFRASMISSLIVSTVFSIAKNIFIYYVILNKTYSTIYGSFAILIFLFLWIYISWIIFLYGMKLCYLLNRASKRDKELKAIS